MINKKNLQPIELSDLIRVGKDNDGGYIIPKRIIDECDGLLSYGINKDWSFEKDFYKKKELNIHCYDHSLTIYSLIKFSIKSFFYSIFYFLILDSKRLNRSLKGINIITCYYSFFKNKIIHFKNKIWNDNIGQNITVPETIKKIEDCGSKKIFIKMDIEGAEYKVLNSIIDSNKNIIGFAVEFHEIITNCNIFNNLIDNLKKSYYIAHIHGNNYSKIDKTSNFPSSIELTFIHKCLIKYRIVKSRFSYPIEGLDQPNKHSKADIKLNFLD